MQTESHEIILKISPESMKKLGLLLERSQTILGLVQ